MFYLSNTYIDPALKEAGFFYNLIITIKTIKYNRCYMARYMLTPLVRKSLCRKDLRPRPPRARKSLVINNLGFKTSHFCAGRVPTGAKYSKK